MREIKFRAWDKINKKWLNLYQIVFASCGSVICVKDMECEHYGEHQVELVQYTGRNDKNGNEIYEGHIVKYGPFPRFHHYCIELVKWSDDIELPAGFGPACGFDFAHESEFIEIIGHEFENPELLKGKRQYNIDDIQKKKNRDKGSL